MQLAIVAALLLETREEALWVTGHLRPVAPLAMRQPARTVGTLVGAARAQQPRVGIRDVSEQLLLVRSLPLCRQRSPGGAERPPRLGGEGAPLFAQLRRLIVREDVVCTVGREGVAAEPSERHRLVLALAPQGLLWMIRHGQLDSAAGCSTGGEPLAADVEKAERARLQSARLAHLLLRLSAPAALQQRRHRAVL
eukprot:scaffold82519_cov37-Phaeocystis_antarctica.AAC.4